MKIYPTKTILSLSVLALGIISYHSARPQVQTAVTKTRAVEVVSLSESEAGDELRLKNVSSKTINGYSIAFEGGRSRIVDLTVGARTIAPMEQFTVRLPTAAKGQQMTVMFVAFEDGTGDGDAEALQELQQRRAGRSLQLKRIVPLLHAAAVSGDIVQLTMQLRGLPEKAEGQSFYAELGMQEAKEDVLRELGTLDENDLKSGLAKIAGLTSKRLERLQVKESNP